MKFTNEKPLEQTVSTTGITIVDFWAEWCGPCRMLAPILDSIESDNLAHVVKVDTEEYPDLAVQYGINALPTMQFYKDGVLIKTQTGALPKPRLISIIQEL